MKPLTKLWLALAALLVAVGFCTYQLRRWRTAEAELSRAARAMPVAPRALGMAARPMVPVSKERATRELPARVKDLIAKAGRGPGGVPLVPPEDLFADVPELKSAFEKAAAAQQRLGYVQFVRTVGLSAAEEAQFLAILAKRESGWGEARVAAVEHGIPRNDPAVAAMDAQTMAAAEVSLQALLGANRYTQLQSYRDTLDARIGLLSLNALVRTSYRTDTPLTLEQMNRLATLTTESGALSYEKAMAAQDGVPFDRVIAEARTILTPAQAEVFELLMDYQQVSQTYSRIIRDRKK